MDRVLRAQPATLTADWEEVTGNPLDPGDPVNVAITFDSTGTVINTTATGGPGSGRSVSLTPLQTASLDFLTLTWTATDGSVITTYAEIVGGFCFSLSGLRMRSPLQDTNAYPNSVLVYYRTLAEMAIEDICGVAFVPRYTREEMSIEGYGVLSGSRRRIRTVRQITTQMNVNGIGQQMVVPNLNGLQIINGTEVYFPALWSWWSRPVMCAYEHGYDQTPPRVRLAMSLLARRWIVESPWDERATGFRTRDGGEMSILTASHSDPFDIPEVVAVVGAYGMPMIK